MTVFFGAAIALLFPAFIGYQIISLILQKPEESSPIERAALSFIAGSAALTFWMFILMVLRAPFSMFSVALPWALMSPALILVIKRKKACVADMNGWKSSLSSLLKLRFLEMLLAGLILLKMIYVFFQTLIKPVVAWDAFAFWSMKAKILFFERGLLLASPSLETYIGKHGPYPPHIPLLEVWMSLCIGSWHDIAVKIFFPIFFACIIVLLYSSLRRTNSRIHSLAFSFLFSSIPLAVYHGAIAYADLPIALFYTASVIFLYRYIKENNMPFLFLSAVLAAIAAWTKNEGLPLLFINMAILLSFYFKAESLGAKQKIKLSAAYMIIGISSFLSWDIFKRFASFPASADHMPRISELLANSDRLSVIITRFFERMFFSGNWHVLWLAVLLAVLFNFRKAFSFPRLALTAALGLNILLLGFIYYSTSSYRFLLDGTALNRNLLIFVPLAVLLIGEIFEIDRKEKKTNKGEITRGRKKK